MKPAARTSDTAPNVTAAAAAALRRPWRMTFRPPMKRSVKAAIRHCWHTFPMRRCRSCLLPSTVPDSGLDGSGLCAHCRNYRPEDEAAAESARLEHLRDLEATLAAGRRGGSHDAVVCLSGGKDSLYLLQRLKVDYGLNVLAFTVDA